MQDQLDSGVIELHFPIRGVHLPCDHAYSLYGAICKLIPAAHNADWLGIHTIKGRKLGRGLIELGRFPQLKLRLPVDKITTVYKLSGARLSVADHFLQCGIPEIWTLRPAKKLRSRFVMIKCKGSEGKSADASSFLSSLQRQISALGVSADVALEKGLFSKGSDELVCRRVVRVKSVVLTGYGVILDNLTEKDSLIVQESGLGGKRRMGCGLFEPVLD